MRCEDCRELMTAYLKEELDEQQHEAVEQHLAQCFECRRELKGVRKVLSIADAADDAPVNRILKKVISTAIEQGASDIHVQRLGDGTMVRFRIDGVLDDVIRVPDYVHEPLVARILVYDFGNQTGEK